MKKKILIGFITFFVIPVFFAGQKTDETQTPSLQQLQELLAKARQQQTIRQPGRQQEEAKESSANSRPRENQTNGQVTNSAENAAIASVEPVGGISADEAIDESAFRQAVKNNIPLSPNQVRRFRRKVHENELAKSTLPDAPPEPVASSQFVSLAPGDNLPVIRLQQGFVTSLVFLDSTGAPWPIADYDLGNPQAFNIQWDKKSNTLLVQATKLFTYGNLAVRLKSLPTPVMLTLIPGQKVVDYRADLRVQGLGPNAKDVAIGQSIPPATSAILLSVLDHVPPPGARKLDSGRDDVKAWIYNGRMFVRSRLPVLSPVWDHTVSSADGMHAYQIPITSLLLLSEHGKVVQLKLKGL